MSLARSPLVLAGTDGTPLPTEVGATFAPDTVCQPEEVVPKGTTIVRMSLLSLLGPGIKLRATAGGQVVTTGVELRLDGRARVDPRAARDAHLHPRDDLLHAGQAPAIGELPRREHDPLRRR